nr:MAG TPA: Replication associated protein [Microviridae sp.]
MTLDEEVLKCISMPCYSPLRIRNPALESSPDKSRERRIKKIGTRRQLEELNGYLRVYIDVPCGKCFGCMRMRCEGWVFRHLLELKQCTSAHFVTLTYDDEHIPISPSGMLVFNKSHVQKYIKRVRKYLERYKIKIKYHVASEYGDTFGRPHYHMLLYNYPLENADVDKLALLWEYGNVQIGTVTEASIRYVVEYITQYYYGETFDEDDSKPFALYSKNLGNASYKAVADYILASGIKLYNIDGKYYRVPSSFIGLLLDKNFLSPLQVQRLADNAQNYYAENLESIREDCENRGISPYCSERDWVTAKARQQRKRYELRKSSKY